MSGGEETDSSGRAFFGEGEGGAARVGVEKGEAVG